MDLLRVLVAILLPPLGVFFKPAPFRGTAVDPGRHSGV
ncbi:YqaE/Pmp3 family membrane protein [Marinobacter sp.]